MEHRPILANSAVTTVLLTILAMGTSSTASAQTPQELAAKAAEAMQRKDFAQAEEYFERILEFAPKAAELHSNLGSARYLHRNYRGAEASFRTALRYNPQLFAPNFLMGRILFDRSRYEEARGYLKTALTTHRNETEVRRLLAAVLVGLEEYQAALAHLQHLLDLNSEDPETLYQLGRVYLHLGQKAYDRLKDYPGSAFHSLVDAEFNSHRPRWREVAEKAYRASIEAAPETGGLRTAMGMFLLKSGDHAGARKAFQDEIALDGSAYEGHFGLAAAHLVENNLDGAMAELEQAVRIRPEYFDPLPMLPLEAENGLPAADLEKLSDSDHAGSFGALYLLWQSSALKGSPEEPSRRLVAERKRDESVRLLRRADEGAGRGPAAEQCARGEEKIRKKRFEEGIRLLLADEARCLSTLEAQTLLARALFESRRYQGLVDRLHSRPSLSLELIYLLGAGYRSLAMDTLEKLATLAPESARVHQLLGDSLVARELYSEAAGEYEIAVKAQPNNPELLLVLGNAYYFMPDFDKAAEVYRRVLDLNPDHPEATFLLGACLVRTHQPEKAVPLLERALTLDPGLVQVHAHLGSALEALDRPAEAVKHVEIAASTDTDGTLHYQLFRLFRKLGQQEKASAARARSLELRKKSEAADMSR